MRILIRPLLVCFSFCILCTCLLAQNGTDMNQALQAYRAQQYEKSLTLLDRIIDQNPGNTTAYHYRGNVLFMLGQYRDAEMDYLEAVSQLTRQATRSPNQGVLERDQMLIVDPMGSQRSDAAFAALYNNLGAVRFLQGRLTEAQRDFQAAARYNPQLYPVQQNMQFADPNRPTDWSNPPAEVNPGNPGSRYGNLPGNRTSTGSVGRYNRDRPLSYRRPDGPRKQREESSDLRESRLEVYDEGANGPSRGDGLSRLFGRKPFTARKVSSRGKTYTRPDVGFTSQGYVRIERVKITPRATVVTFKVVNPDDRTYKLSIGSRSNADAFTLVGRNSNGTYRSFGMRRAEGIATYPKTTELKPGQELIFAVEFPKIADTMGFVNILEGNRGDGNGWNFYEVDLRR